MPAEAAGDRIKRFRLDTIDDLDAVLRVHQDLYRSNCLHGRQFPDLTRECDRHRVIRQREKHRGVGRLNHYLRSDPGSALGSFGGDAGCQSNHDKNENNFKCHG